MELLYLLLDKGATQNRIKACDTILDSFSAASKEKRRRNFCPKKKVSLLTPDTLPATRVTTYLRQGEGVMIPGWKYSQEGTSLRYEVL